MKEQSFQTISQQKAMYLKSVRPVEVLYRQPYVKPQTVKVTLGKYVNTNAIKGRGGSI
tara:strand:+ start:7804 stop:7977 length:174 start_codon:yes stop_codon:yes gene_type:complete